MRALRRVYVGGFDLLRRTNVFFLACTARTHAAPKRRMQVDIKRGEKKKRGLSRQVFQTRVVITKKVFLSAMHFLAGERRRLKIIVPAGMET